MNRMDATAKNFSKEPQKILLARYPGEKWQSVCSGSESVMKKLLAEYQSGYDAKEYNCQYKLEDK